MQLRVDPYPVLDDVLLTRMGFSRELPRFTYSINGTERNLASEQVEELPRRSDSGKFRLTGMEWHPETQDLKMEISAEIMTPSFMFGPRGLAARKDAVLGIAIRWKNLKASLRGASSIALLQSDHADSPWIIHGSVSWPPGQLRGSVEAEIVLYLARAGHPDNTEKHLAAIPGTILGVLYTYEVIVEGSGSLFPVRYENARQEPLWRVDCDWADPFDEPFTDDSFCLILNQAHPDFSNVKPKDSDSMTPFMKEIVISALQLLIQKAMEDPRWTDIVQGNDLPVGTVAHEINYLISTFDLDSCLSSREPEKLAAQLRRSVDRRKL